MKAIFALISIHFVGFPSITSFDLRKYNERVPSDKFLFAASISSNSEHVCSATILNKWWIITSAICISPHKPDALKVYYGSHNRTHNQRIENIVEKVILHPDFDAENLFANLALIKMKNHIRFIPTVVQAVTISVLNPAENDAVFAVGWEKIDESNESDSPEMLKYYKTEVVAPDVCWKLSVSHSDANKINEQIICTHATIENTLMSFDSGSALLTVPDGKLIGIASWRDDDIPNAYVKVRTFVPWIRSVIFGENTSVHTFIEYRD